MPSKRKKIASDPEHADGDSSASALGHCLSPPELHLDPISAKLVARCGDLRVPCVLFSGDQHAIASDNVPVLVQRWLGSPRLIASLSKVHHSQAGVPSDEPILLFDGCWAIPIRRSREEQQSILAVVTTSDAVSGSEFTKACANIGADPQVMRDGLRCFHQPSPPDPQVVSLVLRYARKDAESASSSEIILREFSERLAQSYEETHVLFRIMRYMASAGSPRDQMMLVCNQVQQVLPFTWVLFSFKDSEFVEASLRGQQIVAGSPPSDLHDIVNTVSDVLNAQRADNWTRILFPGQCPLATLTGAEVMCEPITHEDVVIGSIFAGNKAGHDKGVASPEMQFIDAVADFLGTYHENAMRFAEQQAMFLGTLHALTAAIDAKDRYTSGHSERVALLSWQIALAMGLSGADAERVRIAGLVHDIGKIGVPEAILCKPGHLTDDEFAAVKRHPEIGHGILRGIKQLADVLPGVLHHHERFDGRGYPHRLQGDQIPLMARIIGIADTMDAMSSSRSYRPALSRDHVLDEIQRNSGAQFDPVVVEAFFRVDLALYEAQLARSPTIEPIVLRKAA